MTMKNSTERRSCALLLSFGILIQQRPAQQFDRLSRYTEVMRDFIQQDINACLDIYPLHQAYSSTGNADSKVNKLTMA